MGANVVCPHGGQTQVVPTSPRVLLGGQPAATLDASFLVAGCAFTVGTKPQPCVTVRWFTPAVRVRISGAPAILQSSTGVCQSAEQIPNGPPVVAATQVRARGT